MRTIAIRVLRQRFFLVFALILISTTWSSLATAELPLSFISKSARALRYAKPLSQNDDLLSLKKMSKNEVLDEFMRDPAFMDTLLDFNLYFLNRKEPTLYTVGKDGHRSYGFFVFDSPHAITSAREAFTGGDYLKLLSWEQPLYASRNENPASVDFFAYPEETDDPIPKDWDWERQRQKILGFHLTRSKNFIEWIQSKGNKLDRKEFCTLIYEKLFVFSPQAPFLRAAMDQPFFYTGIDWTNDLTLYCAREDAPYEDPTPMVQKFTDQLLEVFKRTPLHDPENYTVRTLLDLHTVGPATHFLPKKSLVWNNSFFFNVDNSSTNFNRKRAKYVLSTYFCDDLTPIAFNEPNQHVKGKHGSDPACYACHYRLDPMAGFFRSLGSRGLDYTDEKNIRFDDGAKSDLGAYLKNWIVEDPVQPLRVGFVRSDSNHLLNDYGNTFSDLEKVIQKAPEVRACIVKKLSQYLLGEDLMLSGGFLATVTADFETQSKINSSWALKNAIKTLLKSQSFVQTDPSPTQCYDYGPGEDPLTQPPCKIAHLLQKNCVMCHSNTTGSGRLDLAHWTKTQSEWSFPHLDEKGVQISRKATLSKVLDRISSSDPKLQMPVGKHMAPESRTQLYLWIQGELK